MKIVVSADTNEGQESKVAHHFGRCPFFALVEVKENEILSTTIIENPYFESHQPGQVPGFVNDQDATVMLSGGMGRRAIEFFKEYGIDTATGATGARKEFIDIFSTAFTCK